MALESILGNKLPALRVEHPDSLFEMWTLPNGLYVTRNNGYGHLDTQVHMKSMEASIAAGVPITVFHDWEKGTDYDNRLQLVMVNWTRKYRKSIRNIVLLTSSSIIGMAVTTGNMLLSTSDFHMKHYRERDKFEAALKATLDKLPRSS